MKAQLGAIVAFYQARSLELGIISECAEGRFRVISAEKDCGWYAAARFVLISNRQYPLDEVPRCLEIFSEAMMVEAKKMEKVDFSFLDKEHTLEQIITRLELSSDSAVFALYNHLKAHPELFSFKKELFRLKSEQEQEQYLSELALGQQRQRYLAEVQLMIDGKQVCEDTLNLLYKELPELLLENKHRDLQRILRDSIPLLSSQEAALKLRRLCGELGNEIDPAIAEAGIPVGFSPQVMKDKLQAMNWQNYGTEAFCIDDADTRDYDDAISLQRCEGGWLLGIHVSAVAACISRDSFLLGEALRRSSSLYAANAIIPLFPPHLSEKALSLTADSEKPVISLYLELDDQLNVQSRCFKTEMVKITNNYSYRQVDKALNLEPFSLLQKFCAQLQHQRQSANAGDKQQCYYYLKEQNGVLRVKRVDNLSPARIIIEELMIEYNSSFAAYAVRCNCPMIFRNITVFGNPNHESPASQAYLSTTADFHPGIGASQYLHATSPIRRTTDLLNQYQMLALLEGKPLPYDTDELDMHIQNIEKRLLLLREVGHRSQRYWLLKFLEQDCLHEPIDAFLRGEYQGKLRFELSPWGFQVLAKCDTYPHHEEFKIVIYSVDWEDWSVVADIL